MDKDRKKTLLLFNSVHEVLAAERRLRGIGTQIDVVPVPKELSSNCGVALEVVQKDLEAIADLLERESLKPQGVYIKHGKEYLPGGPL
jgi:hypothetical protein